MAFVQASTFKGEITPFSQSFLVLNSMSAGQVGTIALDLLISNNADIQKIGFYKSAQISSFVEMSKQGTLLLPGEFYQQGNCTFLIIRGGVKTGRKREFLEELLTFFRNNKFLNLTLLSSLPVSERPAVEINSPFPLAYYFQNPKANLKQKIISEEQLNSLTIIQRQNQTLVELFEGAGLAYHFIKRKEFDELPFCGILVYAAPGADLVAGATLLKAFINSVQGSNVFKPFQFSHSKLVETSTYDLSSVNY